MHKHPGPFRSLAATARLANLPSVVSNVWLGVLPAILTSGSTAPRDFALRSGAVTLAAVCLYLCGGFLNDWADRQWDAAHRPERALPRGLFAAGLYLVLAACLAALGLTAAAWAATRALPPAMAITLSVVLYTWLHKRSAVSMVFMGLCRALLPVLGWSVFASATSLPLVTAAAMALWFHVAGISIMARRESSPQPAESRLRLDSVFFLLAMLAAFSGGMLASKAPLPVCAAALIPYGISTMLCMVRRMPMPARISGLLAGIPLVDCMLLLPMVPVALVKSASMHVDGGLIAACLWLPPLAFLTGRALQRLAPAT